MNEEALAHWGGCRAKKKAKITLLQAWTTFQGYRRLRLPEFLDSLYTGTHFSQSLSRPQVRSAAGGIKSVKKFHRLHRESNLRSPSLYHRAPANCAPRAL